MAVRVIIALGVAAALGVLLLGLLWAFQRRLIYLPFGRPGPAAAHGLPEARSVVLETEDGLTLAAWQVEPARPNGGGVIVFNGNAGHRGDRAPVARWLADAGWTVLLFDYRGYADNPGAPTERGLIRDARAAVAQLESAPGVDPERIVYFGESLGTGVAVATALERPPAALVLRSPFTSLADVGRLHYPFLPVRRLLADRFDSVGRIKRIEVPLLIVAGEQDSIVPLELSRALFEAAPGRATRLVTIPGADHNDFALLDGAILVDAVREFLDLHVAPHEAPSEDR